MDGTCFLSPKSSPNDAATAIMLHQSNHQCFVMKVCLHRKVEVQYYDRRSSFSGVTACNDIILIDFQQLANYFEDVDFSHWQP